MAKILLVDDDGITRAILTRLLVKEGHNVIEAHTGNQAIDIVNVEQPSLIIMDMNMPEMDGLEATRLIKRNEKIKHIPILVLSAHSMPSYVAKAKQLEAGDDYDTKPIDSTRFLNKVVNLLARSK